MPTLPRLRPVRTPVVAVVVAVAAVALAVTTAAPLGAGTMGGDGSGGSGDTGLGGHTITFTVTSKDSPTACVSYYETTEKGGPAKHLDRVENTLVDVPWTVETGTGTKVRHWRIAAWATDDCVDVKPPDGRIKCSIAVDGKRRVRAKGTDQIVFCDI